MHLARAIYHWTDNRIKRHLTLYFLAYFCEAQMIKLLREKEVRLENKAIRKGIIDNRPLTIGEAMQELAEVRKVPAKFKNNLAWVRNEIRGNSAKLLKAIGAPKTFKVHISSN